MPDLRQLLRKPVVYTVPGMEHVHVRKNLVYKTVAGDQLRLDVRHGRSRVEPGEGGDGDTALTAGRLARAYCTAWTGAACGVRICKL